MMTDEQKAKAKEYRDQMSPEQKQRLKYSKQMYSIRTREALKVKRALYYLNNKDSMNASSREYHRKERELKKDLTEKQYRNFKQPPQTPKVLTQSADKISLKEIADQLGVIVALVRAISRDERYNMPEYKFLRIDGVELYDRCEIQQWITDNNNMLSSIAINGMSRKNRGTITISDNVMLITKWLQETKRVTDYCNKQRVAINSNQFWARMA